MTNGTSRTSQAVALIRAGLDRPHSRDGDPAAQRGLCAGLDLTPPDRLRPSIELRTRYMDGRVTAAIAAGVRQVVICGAGLDDRALRFRTPGVRFFEVDHPATQADKAARLAALGAGPAAGAPDPVLVSCDFESGDVAAALRAHGYRAAGATLFLCEGLLVYLGRDTCDQLLASLAAVAGPGSTLAVTLATYNSGEPSAVVVADANSRRRTAATEPWRTILPAVEHLAMLADAGWRITDITDSPPAGADVSHGRRSLLVTAVPAARSGA